LDEPQETHVNPRSYALAKKKYPRSYTEEKQGLEWMLFSIKLVAKGKFPTLSPSVDDNKVIEDSTLKGEDHPRVKRCDQGLEIECKGLCRVEYHD
jgi:hypothetical protein